MREVAEGIRRVCPSSDWYGAGRKGAATKGRLGGKGHSDCGQSGWTATKSSCRGNSVFCGAQTIAPTHDLLPATGYLQISVALTRDIIAAVSRVNATDICRYPRAHATDIKGRLGGKGHSDCGQSGWTATKSSCRGNSVFCGAQTIAPTHDLLPATGYLQISVALTRDIIAAVSRVNATDICRYPRAHATDIKGRLGGKGHSDYGQSGWTATKSSCRGNFVFCGAQTIAPTRRYHGLTSVRGEPFFNPGQSWRRFRRSRPLLDVQVLSFHVVTCTLYFCRYNKRTINGTGNPRHYVGIPMDSVLKSACLYKLTRHFWRLPAGV